MFNRQKPHRGRIQAQGQGTEKSVAWAKQVPPTQSEGQKMVDQLEMQLTPKERRDREEALEKARQFIDRAATAGGISAPSRQTFPRQQHNQLGIRVDIEVIAGQAFIQD